MSSRVLLLVLGLVAFAPRVGADPAPFEALVDGASASYQAYFEYPTTGEVGSLTITARLVAVPGESRVFELVWRDAATGAALPDVDPYRQLPRRLTLGAQGLKVDAYGPTLPPRFDRMSGRPARLRSGRTIVYARDALGCFELYSPGADPDDYRMFRTCFAADGVLREFVFDSASSSLELAGPVTLPAGLVGSWGGERASDGRSFAATLALDDAGRLLGRYVTTAAWATDCTVVQTDDAQHPEVVSVHLRCEEQLGGDEPSVEHADCAMSLVGGELTLERCAGIDVGVLRRRPAG